MEYNLEIMKLLGSVSEQVTDVRTDIQELKTSLKQLQDTCAARCAKVDIQDVEIKENKKSTDKEIGVLKLGGSIGLGVIGVLWAIILWQFQHFIAIITTHIASSIK
jgi:hypothetical protein